MVDRDDYLSEAEAVYQGYDEDDEITYGFSVSGSGNDDVKWADDEDDVQPCSDDGLSPSARPEGDWVDTDEPRDLYIYPESKASPGGEDRLWDLWEIFPSEIREHKGTVQGSALDLLDLPDEEKAACPSRRISEKVLFPILAEVLHTEDPISESARIDQIVVYPYGRLTIMVDGRKEERTWSNPSRSESWTDDMRLKAAQKAQRRKKT